MALLTVFYLFGFLLFTLAGDGNDIIEHKVVLKPAELAGLVLQERIKSELKKSKPCNNHKDIVTSTDSDDLFLVSNNKMEESNDDYVMLKNRKTWSRWSKWGSCSVSCGPGYMARQRACVGGPCARGEREEQRRPCLRSPCPHVTRESHHTPRHPHG